MQCHASCLTKLLPLQIQVDSHLKQFFGAGALENIVVRVGDNNPLEAGLSSNSLCTLAGVNASSSMISYKCQAPVSGLFISISRNDAGSMNVCAFSANLGTTAFAPNFALGKLQCNR